MKPLSAFPPICDQIWQHVLSGALQRSEASDPCSFASTQFLDCPDRSACEALRYDLQNYRTAVGRHALDGKLERDQRSELGILHARMMTFTVAPRNMLFPQFRRFGGPFYALEDGPHRLYFAAKRDKHTFVRGQLSSPVVSPSPLSPSPGVSERSLLDELGYGSGLATEPLSEEDL